MATSCWSTLRARVGAASAAQATRLRTNQNPAPHASHRCSALIVPPVVMTWPACTTPSLWQAGQHRSWASGSARARGEAGDGATTTISLISRTPFSISIPAPPMPPRAVAHPHDGGQTWPTGGHPLAPASGTIALARLRELGHGRGRGFLPLSVDYTGATRPESPCSFSVSTNVSVI